MPKLKMRLARHQKKKNATDRHLYGCNIMQQPHMVLQVQQVVPWQLTSVDQVCAASSRKAYSVPCASDPVPLRDSAL